MKLWMITVKPNLRMIGKQIYIIIQRKMKVKMEAVLMTLQCPLISNHRHHNHFFIMLYWIQIVLLWLITQKKYFKVLARIHLDISNLNLLETVSVLWCIQHNLRLTLEIFLLKWLRYYWKLIMSSAHNKMNP